MAKAFSRTRTVDVRVSKKSFGAASRLLASSKFFKSKAGFNRVRPISVRRRPVLLTKKSRVLKVKVAF